MVNRIVLAVALVLSWTGLAGAVLCSGTKFVKGTNPESCQQPATASYYEVGTVTNGGTATCNFANALGCHMTIASGASITIANPINLPTKAFVIITATLGAIEPQVTWGNALFGYAAAGNSWGGFANLYNGGKDFFFTDSTGGTVSILFYSDGTNMNSAQPIDIEAQAGRFNQLYGISSTTDPSGYWAPAKNTIELMQGCAGYDEGSQNVATDCNASCTNGGTCAGGGTTHCQLYCNGSAWVETGR